MRVYQCDACGIMITKPHEENMKEFTVICESDSCGVFPMNFKNRVKVDLCEECYHGLHIIAELKRSAGNG